MALLRVANLRKSYNITKTQKQDVLKGIDIEFKSGDLVALLGESGCGKSTFINILGGLDTDYTGSVVIKGDFIRDFSEKEMDDYRKKRVGLIFQNYNLISHMTIKENVEIAMAMSDIDTKMRSDRAMDLLKMVGLSKQATKLPNQLSGGQKQRVAIARALANNPTIILADEPTGALDEESAQVIMKILKKLAESGKLVIIVTHSDKVASQCGRVIKMEGGKIVDDQRINKLHIDSKRDKEVKPRSIRTKDLLKIAVNNVKQNKGRSFLVSFGLAIGMAAVLLILCLSSGLTGYVNDVYGENLLSTQIVVTKSSGKFSDEDIGGLNKLDGVEKVIQTYSVANVDYNYSTSSTDGTVSTLQCYYDGFYVPEMLHGSVSADTDDVRYIIINEAFASVIGKGSLISMIGEEIVLNVNKRLSFIISGVYEDLFDDSAKVKALISDESMRSLTSTTSSTVNTLYVKAKDVTYVEALSTDISKMGYTVAQEENSAGSVISYIDMGTQVLTAVSAVSMVVSAIMIFIVLYISVTERMREIGILRAVGARKSDIRKMFIFEAVILGIIGGLLAVAMCFLISLITNIVCANTIEYTLISYNVIYYLIGIAVSAVVSMLAGIAPAMRASDLDPVETLRAE